MTSSAVAAARTILTRLHDVMASRSAAQVKLNTVVEVIGSGLNSEVCSVYLLRYANKKIREMGRKVGKNQKWDNH